MSCVCVLCTDGLSMDRDGRERAVRKREPFEQRRTSRTLSKNMLRVGADLPVCGSAVSGKHSSWAQLQIGAGAVLGPAGTEWPGFQLGLEHSMDSVPSPGVFPHAVLSWHHFSFSGP